MEGTIYINNVLKKATNKVEMGESPKDTPIKTLEKEFEVIEDEIVGGNGLKKSVSCHPKQGKFFGIQKTTLQDLKAIKAE